MLTEARQQFSMGKPEQAEALLQQVLAKNPRELQAIAALGMVAAETGRRDLALKRMKQVLELDPKFLPALCWASILLFERDQIAEAKKYAQQAILMEPRNAAMYAVIARCSVKLGDVGGAIGAFQKAIELNPTDASLFYDFSELLLATGQEHEAIKVQRKAVSLAPNAQGELKLAQLELSLGKIEMARVLCESALLRDPTNGSAHSLMARILTEQLELDDAEDHWKQAGELNPTTGALSLEKGLALVAIGHFESSIKEFEASIQARPRQGASYQGLAFSKRITSADMPLIEQMEKLLSDRSLSESEQTCVLYALGKSYDNLGDYATSIKYFDRANLLKKRALGGRVFNRQGFRAFIDDRIKLFSKEFFKANSSCGVESALPILIVGMMRSGTTLAQQMLSCHSQIGGAGEQSFWGSHETEMADFAKRTVNRGVLVERANEYVELLTTVAPGFSRVIDKNPANLQVLGSFHLAFSNAKIIHTRRNAIDTAISIWTTPMRTNAPFMYDRDSIVFAYKEYIRLMDHWREVFPSDRFMEVHYEDLARDAETTIPKMVEFCGMDWEEACLHPELNRRRIKTPSMWQARQPVYRSSTDRWKNYQGSLGVFEELEGLN